MDLDQVIEIGRKRLARLRETYHPDSLRNGSTQTMLSPEEFEILLVAGTESTRDLESLRPTKLRWPTVIHVTPEQLDRMLNVHLKPTGSKNAPQSRDKQRPNGAGAAKQAADV